MNLMTLLEMACQGHGERRALSCGGASYSYAELYRAAGRMAADLRTSRAAHVALLDVGSPAVPIALFASAWAGLPFVPLNYRLAPDALDGLLARIAPARLIADAPRVAALAARDGLEARARADLLTSAGDASGAPVPDADWGMDPDALAILLFTSGTTGAPKAAVLRHKHLTSYVLGSVEFGAAAEDDAGLLSVPPYHIAGVASILTSVYAGRRIVQLPEFSAEAWLRTAREERVTHAFVVPTMLARILDALGGAPADLPQLRALSYGGGKMPRPVIERALAAFPGVDFANAYGLTETSSTLSILYPQDHRDALASDEPAVRRRMASVGRPLPGVEVEIRDADGKPVGPGVVGEIHVRGEQVAGEYLEQGSRVERDGFFPTRDGGFLDEAGYLYLEGRIDDVIVRGGENMSPGEIEDVLLEHPAVADACVVGVPDEQWGEAVAAVLALRPGATGDDALRAALQEHVRAALRGSRVPGRVEFRDALPYNETGKLLRREVRAWLAKAPG
jgi:acyl-CoA synthetase (AMP-forming)/AMP-acid ligase II